MAKRAEAAALAFDPRITNSEGASFDSNIGGRVFANSRGFLGSYRSSYCSRFAPCRSRRKTAHGARLLVSPSRATITASKTRKRRP